MSNNSDYLEETIKLAVSEVLGEDGKPVPLNEAETRTHLIDPVLSALGYSSLAAIRREYRLEASGQFVDYLLYAGQRRVVVEAKAASLAMTPKDSAQLVGYCAQEGIRWALLTNGLEWHIFDVEWPGDWREKRVERLDVLDAHRRGTLKGPAGSLAQFERAALIASGAALDSWSERARAGAIIAELTSGPDSPIVEAARRELASRGIAVDPVGVLELLQEAFGGSVADPHTPVAPTPTPALPEEGASTPQPSTAPTTSCYLFSASAQGGSDGQTGLDVLRELLGLERWGVRTKAGLRTQLRPGDKCCFYAAGEGVVAEAEIGGLPSSAPSVDGYYPVPLANVRWLESPVVLGVELRSQLDAFEGKDPKGIWSWFVQGSIQRLTMHDYKLLTGGG